jgi:hypothetical protein
LNTRKEREVNVDHFTQRRTRRYAAVGAVAAIMLTAMTSVADARQEPPVDEPATAAGQGDRDDRRGARAPSARQRALATAPGQQVQWNEFGTPASLRSDSGALADDLAGGPVRVARAWVNENRALFGLSEQSVAELELIYSAPVGPGRAVLFRQRFGDLVAGHDGLLSVGVRGDAVVYVTSSVAPDGNPPQAATVTAAEAVRTAAADAGRDVALDEITERSITGDTQSFDVAGFAQPVHVRLVAVPTPRDGVRSAWEVVLTDDGDEPVGFSTFVDARSDTVLLREDLVDHQEDPDPQWTVFPASPPLDYSSTDTRERWCWSVAAPGCARLLAGSAPAPLAWDVVAATGTPSYTTRGNNTVSYHNWLSTDPFTVGTETATPRPDRAYTYPWTNQWYEQQCNPATTFSSPERNDIDAARANLFAMHNQMHDWSYRLGFTERTFNMQVSNFGRGGAEGDPEQGNAQAGGVPPAPPGLPSRDNANQITPRDGLPPITNMYLWQPLAAAFYAPCVDGDYDMSVIGHEYTHAISNRMVAGPDSGLSGSQAGAMGESWSDLAAVEQLQEYGLVPVADENPFAVGPYATGDKKSGIRNYGMNVSPLNYSDVGYDFACNTATCAARTQVHADGEIWSATNYDIREAMNARYDADYPSSDAALQLSCADGTTPVAECPGNRRWIQLVFDAWTLMATGSVSMVDARNAMLAADQMRFGGDNQDLLWDVFARQGLGELAASTGTNDVDPRPSFESPHADEGTLVFAPRDADGNPIAGARLFIGRYEAAVTPVADTDPTTALTDRVRLMPGSYEVVVQAPGYGHWRDQVTLRARTKEYRPKLSPNLASRARGATASGDGINLDKLIDDTEATNWASLGSPVAGKHVTVVLDPSAPVHTIRRIQVSAMLRTPQPADPGGDTAGQNRFSALRQFEFLACRAQDDVDCTDDSDYKVVFKSSPHAFGAVAPRPRAPDLIIRSFNIPQIRATHVQLRVLTNQCTGGPDYAGELDADPANVTDCAAGSTQDDNVRTAELQVFGN